MGLATCQRSAPALESPSDSPPTTEEPVEAAEPTPASDPTHPLELVPARARIMMMARSPQRLAEIFERERLSGQYSDLYGELVEDMKRGLGHDLLDPAEQAAVGIDPTGPIGFAVLSLEDEALVFFGRSTDPEAMLTMLQTVAREPLSTRTIGAARLVRLDRELTVVLRHGMWAVVFVDRQRDGQPDYPAEVARIDPAQSLAHAFAMERAHAGLPAEADLSALLDVAGIVRDELGRGQRDEQRSIARAHQRIAEARQRGATPEEIDSLQQDLQSEQSFAVTRRRQRQIADMLLSRTVGAIEGIGMAVDADDRGLHGRIHMALTPDAVFRDLLAPEDPPSALLALDEDPLLLMSGRVDVDVALELFAQVLMADRSTYAEFEEELSRELRVDVDPTLKRQLTGSATFALTAAPAAAPEQLRDFEDEFSGVLAIGIRDEQAVRELLGMAVNAWPQLKWKEAPAIEGWSLTLDDAPHRLWLAVVAEQLVVSPDRGVIERIRDGKPGTASRHYEHPTPWRWLTEGPATARLGLHHRLPLQLLFGRMGSFESVAFPMNVDFMLESEFPEDDVHSIAANAKVRRLMKQRDAAREKASTLRRRRDAKRRAKAWEVTRGLGITAGSIREQPSGLMMEGGHYTAGGMGHYIEAVIELSRSQDGPTEFDDPIAKAQQRVDEIQDRLVSARRRQLERALRKEDQR